MIRASDILQHHGVLAAAEPQASGLGLGWLFSLAKRYNGQVRIGTMTHKTALEPSTSRLDIPAGQHVDLAWTLRRSNVVVCACVITPVPTTDDFQVYCCLRMPSSNTSVIERVVSRAELPATCTELVRVFDTGVNKMLDLTRANADAVRDVFMDMTTKYPAQARYVECTCRVSGMRTRTELTFGSHP